MPPPLLIVFMLPIRCYTEMEQKKRRVMASVCIFDQKKLSKVQPIATFKGENSLHNRLAVYGCLEEAIKVSVCG